MTAGDLALPTVVASESQGSAKLAGERQQCPRAAQGEPAARRVGESGLGAGSKDSLMAWIVYPSRRAPRPPVVVVIH